MEVCGRILIKCAKTASSPATGYLGCGGVIVAILVSGRGQIYLSADGSIREDVLGG